MTAVGNGRRFADRPVAAGGTPAADWIEWLRDFPEFAPSGCPALTVVAPHPDDETLGFGATASAIRAGGAPVRVITVTDGGAAHPTLPDRGRLALERRRREETRRAARQLGLDEPTFLGLPDGGVAAAEAELTARLTDILAAGPRGAWCAATWRGDGHPDHEAVGRAAAAACARTGARLLEFPVWTWHWARPGDPAVPWHALRRCPIDDVLAQRKREAVASFASQIDPPAPGADPVLPSFVLRRLEAVGEVVFA